MNICRRRLSPAGSSKYFIHFDKMIGNLNVVAVPTKNIIVIIILLNINNNIATIMLLQGGRPYYFQYLMRLKPI